MTFAGLVVFYPCICDYNTHLIADSWAESNQLLAQKIMDVEYDFPEPEW